MCGIAGIIDLNGQPVESDRLQKLLANILHRGPDDSGTYRVQNVGLVHSRLSILDLSDAGHQPMVDADTETCLCYNGEIYNFRVLKDELKTQGVVFNSTGDTEVLL